MKKFIDVNIVKQQFEDYTAYSCCDIEEKLDSVQPADVQEVRHGKWIEYGLKEREGEVMYIRCFRCSECNYKVNEKFKFCPDCGAKMDEERRKAL